MARNVRLRELLVGIEGLALLRHLYDGTDQAADERLADVRRLLDDDVFATSELTSEADPEAGYRSWSATYDEPGNPIIALEEPVVRSLVDRLPPGRALDAGCGTGRHARHLVALGHQVTGIDVTAEMLDRARHATATTASFVQADVRQIPAPAESFSLVVSGLALAHVADLDAAVTELARVLTGSGHLIISVLHPLQALLGWHAPFEDEHGRRRFVREHPHTHADYLRAFKRASLVVDECVEPMLSAAEVAAKRRAFRHVPAAALAAYVGLPAVLVWDAVKIG